MVRLNLTSLKERRQRGDLIQTYKIISHYYSVELELYTVTNNRNLRGHTKKLDKEKCAKLQRKNFISNRVVYIWNGLSEETVTATSVNVFKSRVDKDLVAYRDRLVHYSA